MAQADNSAAYAFVCINSGFFKLHKIVEKNAEELSERLETAEQEKQTLSDQLSEAQSAAATAEEERQKISEELQTAQEHAAGEQERMTKEIEELRIQLETEKKKTWWQKLWGR